MTRRLLRVALALLTAGNVCAFAAQSSGSSGKSPTAKKTNKSKTMKKRGRRERGQKVPTPDRISEIQQALAQDGSYAGAPTGKWDAATVEAMRKFQAAHGLNPTGRLDALSLQKLGLGSETAGVAAPLPPSGSASSRTPSTRQF